jgi:hypothetical protein
VTGEVGLFNIGSSKGVREFFKTDDFYSFVNNNKFNFEFFLKRGAHPFIRAVYTNGYIKDFNLRNYSEEDIKYALTMLNSSCHISLI